MDPRYNNYHQPGLSATFVPGGFDDDYYMPPPAPELISPEPQRINPEMPQQIQHGIQNMNLHNNNINPSSTPTPQPSSQSTSDDSPSFSPFPKLTNRPPGVPQSDDELEATLENARSHVLNSNDPEMQLAWAADALHHVGICADQEERLAAANPRVARSSTPRIEHQLKTDAMNVVTFLADQHHPRAEFLRGMWLEWGRFGQREDKKEAFRCYSRAADRGYVRAEYRIGMLYESYNDPIKALRHYNRGVDAGDAASCYRLGMMTLRGQHGQQQDYRKALNLIQQSAEKADENAAQGAYVYGMLLARQLPQIDVPESFLPPDESAAKSYIEKAAFHRFAKAQLKMGSAYELGSLGCEFSPALSVHYNALAAKQGETEAEMALSKWFLVGSEGLFAKNEELAYMYADRAAHGGLSIAEFALGYFNEIGMHVPVSVDKALEWYHKAFQHGNEDAKGRIDALANKQVLNRKDAEKMAISRIKSQYGSQRGPRPDRFRERQAHGGANSRLANVSTANEYAQGMEAWQNASPASPTYSDIKPYSATSEYSQDSPLTNNGAPARGTTPYPLDNNLPSASPFTRPTSAAPYPIHDGPPGPPIQGRPPPQRLGPAGGFFNNAPQHNNMPIRPSTTVNPDRPSSAFQINPDLRSSSTQSVPQLSHHAPSHSLPPTRPMTTQPPGGHPQGNFRPPLGPNGGGRIASGPPNMQNYNGSGPPRPNGPPQPRPNSKLDIGFSAPEDQRPTYGRGGRPPQQSGPPHQPQNRPPGGHGPGGPPAKFDNRPPPLANTFTKPLPPGPATPGSGKTTPGTPGLNPHSGLGGAVAPPKPTPPKGPKTFEEMGVPASKKESECTIM